MWLVAQSTIGDSWGREYSSLGLIASPSAHITEHPGGFWVFPLTLLWRDDGPICTSKALLILSQLQHLFQNGRGIWEKTGFLPSWFGLDSLLGGRRIYPSPPEEKWFTVYVAYYDFVCQLGVLLMLKQDRVSVEDPA